MNKKILIILLVIFLVLPLASARSFIVHNTSDETQTIGGNDECQRKI